MNDDNKGTINVFLVIPLEWSGSISFPSKLMAPDIYDGVVPLLAKPFL